MSRPEEASVITAVRFEHPPLEPSRVFATIDGKEERLLTFYRDEILFTEGDFIGKTAISARRLHFDRDRNYLTS